MGAKLGSRICLGVVVLILALTLARFDTSPARAAADEPLLVIAGLGFPSDDLRMAELKSAYRGERAQVAGQRIIAINQPVGSPMRVRFDRAVLGLEPDAVGRFWIDRRIRDEDGIPPTSVPSAELAVRVVAALRGAITYCTPSLLNSKVKVLAIDGMSAIRSDYPLR